MVVMINQPTKENPIMDEELYLHCLDCGEAFDSLRPAFDHKCAVDARLRGDEPTYTLSEEL